MFETTYISSSCNQTPTAAHWGKNNLICFGSCNSILIYDPNYGSGGKILDSLSYHQKRVNSVQWITGTDYEDELVSGAADGTAIVWTKRENAYESSILKGHESSVNIVESLYTDPSNKSILVATASADSTIRIWFRKERKDEISQTQKIDLKYGLSLSLKFFHLPDQEVIILASGLDDNNVHLYIEEENSEDSCITFRYGEFLEGHDNWVRGLDFKIYDGDLYLVSSAQDHLIRLWRITSLERQTVIDERAYIDNIEQYNFIMKRKKIETSKLKYIVSLESVIAGHEGWIYSVNWNPEDMTFLSVSIDKSMIIWELDSETNVWVEKTRLGEVGGNTLGFYGGMFGPKGKSIMAYGYHGAFHLWKCSEENNLWEPCVPVGGHFNEVVDISWEPKGEYLMSVSYDQTTRIHAPWKRDKAATTWHQIARPQVHGYDMSCLAILSRYTFASGADEKVIRTFRAPKNFVENFRRLCKINDDEEGDEIKDRDPKGAAVPSLGLSNKAVYEDDNVESTIGDSKKNPYPIESHFTAVILNEPPTEETLLQNTLWPEVQKLYAHVYEIYSLAASPDRKVLASASKSTCTEYAAILLWDMSTWTQIQKLVSHSLTVAQLEFSPDSQHLLSVSRDRRWSLFARKPDSIEYELVATTDKKTGTHTRIIWCCTWTHNSKYFATGSRDGKVVIWTKNPEKESEGVLGQCERVFMTEFKGQSVTALAFAPVLVCNYYLIAVGLESGIIVIYLWKPDGELKEYIKMDKRKGHHLTVKRLRFRPLLGQAGNKEVNENILQLASCGSDYAVKVFDILLPKQIG